ncbi:MAG TPA: extracellular solute-binding protein [Acetobacteraceae bacterium]|nr:extracellular solute-binding protein [Acetobacteraceae bacterium]
MLSRRGLVATTLAAPVILGARARAAGTIQMISHRYPALEYFAEKMRSAIPGVAVNTQLMPFDKALELITIAMSSKSDTPDIVYASDTSFQTFAKNGWLRPLDDLWAKYSSEFRLDDCPEAVRKTYTHDGHLYVVPHTLNTMMFFYRKDLLDAAGKAPPKTIAEYRDMAKSLNSPMRSGSVNCLKPVDAAINEAHWYFNALGDGWFDADWRPVFNSAKGVQAIEMMKEIARYAQQGYTAAANDECMIAYQQDTGVMGLQWATRAKAMDDPAKSRIVGKIDWTPPPQGHGRISGDGYGISAFSKQDPDTLFRIIATSSSEASLRGAASLLIPPRTALLEDPELRKANRFYPAALASYDIGTPAPSLPEFYAVGEFITRRILQAVTGEMPVKQALDTAANETTDFLKGHGYYK